MQTLPSNQSGPALITTQSAAGNLTSAWVRIDQMRTLGFQAVWTGNIAGTFSFEVSNVVDFDLSPPALGVSPLGTATPLTVPAAFASGNPAGAAGSFFFDFTIAPTTKAIRIKYTAASGVGNLTVTLFGRGGS